MMESELFLSYFRGAERLLIVFFGGMSLLLGWHLFKLGVVRDQRAEIKKGDFAVNLQKVGPGVFFALFGAAILVISIIYGLKSGAKNDDEGGSGPSYFVVNSSKQDNFEKVKAINTLRSISRLPPDSDFSVMKTKLLRSQAQLHKIRDALIEASVGKKKYDIWRKHRNDYLANRELIDDETLRVLDDINKWMTTEYK
jgi:hypothetical protein